MIGLGLIWLTFALGWMLQGSRLLKWIEPGLTSFTDFALPWRRKRVQRNFSAMLALALDAGIPERRAVELAARSTANRLFIGRAQTVANALAAGTPLSQAIGLLDETGEFTWRIRNVLQSSGKFVSALSGWHDVLEARATQQEETVSQAVSSSLVLMNGCAVGLFAASVFLLLITIIQEATLW